MTFMNQFIKEALKEAYKGISLGHGGPFGAVIVKDNKIIAKGHNHVVINNDPTCHGEIDAIRKACKKLKTFDLSGCEIYTTGYPCPMCFAAILWANISKVYYCCNTTDTEILGFRDKEFEDNIPILKEQICTEMDRDSGLELYHCYKEMQNKTYY